MFLLSTFWLLGCQACAKHIPIQQMQDLLWSTLALNSAWMEDKLDFSDLPASASRAAEITGVQYHALIEERLHPPSILSH